ncbi:hypothetical protein B0T16DRAFT_432400 [Cercophora newfieldiana]|uniref:non-specific serine/threonine protein kinase n=1 Tax=Cercophora newfieldiana TaxID=92897 RepID=A0AA39XTW8_9PEZI|nr:hypothetical protein B0T16DRAFT_432400 [Cercophora newfieldiana]
MSSTLLFTMAPPPPPSFPSEATVESCRDELDGNLFRGVDGFLATYYDHKPWSGAVQRKLQETESAEQIDKLSAKLPRLADADAFKEWLAGLLSLSSALHRDAHGFTPRIQLQVLSKPSGPLKIVITGGTLVLGIYDPPAAAGEEEEDSAVLSFFVRAQQVFKEQPARRFLHGFLVYGTTLELWVFDRSGAYSSEKIDLTQRLGVFVEILASYLMMSDEELGLNTFVRSCFELGPSGYVAFGQDRFFLRPEPIAKPDYMVGSGTVCYAASTPLAQEPDVAVKFSWRESLAHDEVRYLEQAQKHNVQGVLRLLGSQDLGTVADHRKGLQFPQPFVNRILSCIATSPLGRPIQKFSSLPELLDALCDVVKALRSLYMDARIIHRDIAIKNLIIAPQHSNRGPRGILLDLDQGLDLDNAASEEPLVGSDGFMAIGILSGKRHTYRHDLESLFYVFLWLAIANDHKHEDAYDILEGLPTSSRLWKWCSMDFGSVGQAKAADMRPENFSVMLDEFSPDFVPLQGLAKQLHALIFPIRDGQIFTGTETEPDAVSMYNQIPFIHEMHKAAETHANDLDYLTRLLEKHQMPASVCVKLIHIHFHLNEGEILAVREFDAPPHGRIPLLGPMAAADAISGATNVHGCHYLVDEAGDLQAFEYTTMEGGVDLAAHPAFVSEFCAAVAQRGLQRAFGLAVKSGVATEGEWVELDYPDKRSTFLLPGRIALPQSDKLIQQSTKTQFLGPRRDSLGNTHRHVEHWHTTTRPVRGVEGVESGPREKIAEGVTAKGGFFLTGIPLDPSSEFCGVVRALAAAA